MRNKSSPSLTRQRNLQRVQATKPKSSLFLSLPLHIVIAIRYLFSNKKRFFPSFTTAISFFGTAISTMILVVVMSVMNGFYSQFVNIVIGISPHVFITQSTMNPMSSNTNVADIFKDPSLASKIRYSNHSIASQAMASSHNGAVTNGVAIYGLATKDFNSRDLLKNSLIQGSFNSNDIIVGNVLAQNLHINAGDKITLILAKGHKTLFGTIPIHKEYNVSGIFSVKMQHYDSNVIIMDIKNAQLLFGYDKDEYGAFEITLNSIKDTEYTTKKLKSYIAEHKIPAVVQNWKTKNQSFMEAIRLQSNVMFFILILFVILSSFIMLSSISNMINDKIKSIVILRTMGLSKRRMWLIFFTNGLIISTTAIIFGCMAGGILALNIENIKDFLEQQSGKVIFDATYYFLSYIPSELRMGDIVKISTICFLISLVAIVVPILKLRRLSLSSFLREH